MQTADDLNANADAIAALYAGVALFLDEAGTTVADGGAEQAVTFLAGGVARSDVAGVDGIAWSNDVPFTLTETATHFGLYFPGNVLARVHPLPHPVGPGSVPFACGVGPAAKLS
jgi:hypothetical protein